MLDFLPAFLADLLVYLVVFTLQHVLSDRLFAGGRAPEQVALALSLFGGTYTTIYVIGTPTLGRLADRPGWRRRCIALGCAVMIAVPVALLAGLLESVPALFVSIGTLGAGSALFWPALQARVGERAGAIGLAAALARFNVGWTLGKGLGLACAGELYARGPRAALVSALVAAFVCVASTASDRAPSTQGSKDAATGTSERPQGEKRRFLVAALGTNFAVWGAQATVISLIPVLGRELGLSSREEGWLLAILVLAQAATFLKLRGASGWTYRPGLLLATAPLAALTSMAFFGAGSYPFALAAALGTGLLAGVSYASSIYYSLDYDERRGWRMGINEAVLGIGALLPIVGSAIADQVQHTRVPYAFAAGVCLVAAGLAATSLARR